jgi:SPP1 gp7 family putative phage head morphogenesis protein
MNIEEIKKAIESNSNYWEKRALENKLSAIENEEDYLRRISSIYDHANKQIDEKLARVYARYAKENNLTLEEAYKQLPKKMETEYKKDVMDYVNKAKDPSYKQYLLNQSIMHKHSVLDQLRTEMRDVIYDIDMEETGGKFLEKIFTDSNYRAQYSNNEEAFAKVDKEKIQNLLKENWSGGGNFSELIWKDREKLVKALDDIVMKGLATGDNYDKMSDKLAKRMDTSKSNAKRLIMTESARMENEGLLSYYQRIGAKQLIFVATLDMKTSEICRAMDGTIIPIEDAKIGLNVPPLHPYCRSVISPHYEGNEPGDRVYRDVETGKTKSGRYRTYKEYLEEELGDKEQAEALASTRNDLQTLIMAVDNISNSAKYYNDGTDNNQYKDAVYKIQEDEYNNIHSVNDKYTEEYMDEQFEKVKELVNDKANELVIRVKEASMENILKDGEFKNQYTTLTSGGTYNPDWRKVVENNLFNIPINAISRNRPIYGYISNKFVENGSRGFELQKYGNIKVVLKDFVKDRCYFTMGDSMNNSSRIIPSKLKDIQRYSIRPEELAFNKWKNLGEFRGYPEIQIFGGVKLSDIKYIELPKELKGSEIAKSISDNGIKIRYE